MGEAVDDATEEVILIDEADRPLGTAGKLDAHERGVLHRAFSVLIHDGSGNLLLQKRHPAKYHSGGLWTNTCCGHPRPSEATHAAAGRRLKEEMGFSSELTPLGSLIYRAEVGNGLIEHELVYLFMGHHDGVIDPDPSEAEDWCWLPVAEVRRRVGCEPDRFTYWFRRYLEESWPLADIEAAPHDA